MNDSLLWAEPTPLRLSDSMKRQGQRGAFQSSAALALPERKTSAWHPDPSPCDGLPALPNLHGDMAILGPFSVRLVLTNEIRKRTFC